MTHDPDAGSPSSIARISALHGFYRYASRQGAVAGSPFTDAERPQVDDESMDKRPDP